MEEDPAFPKEECARQIHFSLHSTPQRSHHWRVISACEGNIYFVSAMNTRQYKDPFYLLLLISMKKKIALLKAPFFSVSTNESVFSAIFHTQWLVPVQFDPHQPKWMQQFFILHVLMAAHAMFWMRYIHRLFIVVSLVLYVVVVSAAPLTVLFQDRGVPGDSATNWGNVELQNKTEVTKNLFEVS